MERFDEQPPQASQYLKLGLPGAKSMKPGAKFAITWKVKEGADVAKGSVLGHYTLEPDTK